MNETEIKIEQAEPPPEKVVDKLKKLLRLAASANVHEAGLALARAMELAEKYRVELASLSGEDVEAYVKELFPQTEEDSERWVRTIVEYFFHVKTVSTWEGGERQMAFIGKENDVAFGKFVYDYLALNFKLAWMTYKFQNKLKADHRRDSFYQGLYEGVKEKLGVVREAALTCEKYALVVQSEEERLSKETLNFFPNLVPGASVRIKTDNEKARDGGREVGRQIQISRPLEGKGSQRRLQ